MRIVHLPLTFALASFLGGAVHAAEWNLSAGETNLNIIIPDNQPSGLARTLTVSQSAWGKIHDLQVRLQIQGGYNGDLYALLTHADGFGAHGFTVLLNRVGRSTADPVGSAGSGFDITFSRGGAGGDIHLAATNQPGTMLTGIFEPDGRLDDPAVVSESAANRVATLDTFANVDVNGAWTLLLVDLSGGLTATLVSWSLDFQAAPRAPFIAPPNIVAPTDPGQCDASGIALGTPEINLPWLSLASNAPAQFPVGLTPVIWTLVTTNLDTLTATQTVTVVDAQLPALTPPADLAINLSPGECRVTNLALGAAVAADNCGLASLTSNAPASFPIGVTLVAWTATDIHGNSVTKYQRVSVADPSFSCPEILASLPVITEFMAANNNGLTDEDGEFSDWIEIYNPGSLSVNLLDWSLTDNAGNLSKWKFPATNLAPGQYLVVFASNKNRRNPGQALHTNFRLDAGGEYLALVAPNGLITSQFSPLYPPQFTDVSFGLGAEWQYFPLVEAHTPLRVHVPSNGVLGTAWTLPEFNDGGWLAGTNGAGFETGANEQALGPTAVLALEPAGFWRLNETSGLAAQNQGTNGAAGNGSYLNGVALAQPGPRPPSFAGLENDNYAARFDGADDKVDVPFSPALNGSVFTVACWARCAGGAGRYRSPLTARADAPQRGYMFYATDANVWAFQTGTGGGWDAMTGPAVVLNEWVHLVGIFDGATKSFYVNGVLANSRAVAFSPNNVSPLRIGAGRSESPAGDYFFPGDVDEVAVFGRALSGAEVLQLYQAAVSGVGGGGDPTNFYFGHLLKTDLQPAMFGRSSSAYLRLPFFVTNAAPIGSLTLRMRYDDGFVAYLNGQPAAWANSPDAPAWNSAATGWRLNTAATNAVEFNLSDARSYLRAGTNILAIHGLNYAATNGDFLVQAELVAGAVTSLSTNARYFVAATPGKPNSAGAADLGPSITGIESVPALPAQPAAGDPLTVTARVLPTLAPVASVTLNWRVMFGAVNQTNMLDDGAHGDGDAGDGVYGAIIPGGAALAGQMIRWYVTAADSLNRVSRWPLFDDPLNSPEYLGTVVADPTLATNLPVWHWFAPDYAASHNRTGQRGAVFFNGEFYDNIFVRQRGGYTAQAQSQKFDFNTGYHCRINNEIGRVEEANLNGNGGDPSYMRTPVAFEVFRAAGHPASECLPVQMRFNGAFDRVGLFIEQVDERFLDRRGLDRNGALYKFVQRAQLTPAFSDATDGIEKKTRLDENNSDLQAVVGALLLTNNIEARAVFMFDHLNLAGIVNYLACRAVVRDVDDVRKNWYFYRDTESTGEWTFFPWDKDLSLGIDADAGVLAKHPLMGDAAHAKSVYLQWSMMWEAIFNDPRTRQMYLRRLRSVMDQQLGPAGYLESRVDYYFAPASPFLSAAVSNSVAALKGAIAQRRAELYVSFAATNAAAGAEALVPESQPAEVYVGIGAIDYNPVSGNQLEEYVQLLNTNSFAVDISDWRLDGAVKHRFYPGTVIPASGALYVARDVAAFRARTAAPRGGQILFAQGNYLGQLSARGETLLLADANGRLVATNTYPGSPSPAQQFLRITELMYNPAPGGAFAANEYEYLELKNISTNTPIDLRGVHFGNGLEFAFSDSLLLSPGQAALLVKNRQAFESRYGTGLPVAGVYTGALDNAGERLTLLDAANEEILDFRYDNQWHPITDGLGFSLVVADEQAQPEAWNSQSQWRPCGSLQGTPGADEILPPASMPILINEILSASTGTNVDAIELFNPTPADVAVGGWFLTDNFTLPKKYRLPDGAVVPAGGFLVFSEAQFNAGGAGFALSAQGEAVYLFEGDAATNLTGAYHGFAFGAVDPNVSLGRLVSSDGQEQWVAQSALTLGATNAGPRIGPVIFSEIMYAPDNGVEYVELRNLTGTPVPLYDVDRPASSWRIVGLNYRFPTNTVLAACGTLIVTTTNEAAFRAAYGVPSEVPVFTAPGSVLDDDGENLELQKPYPNDTNGVYITVDRVRYGSAPPWAANALGTGSALHRQPVGAFGNDPANWQAAAPSPGVTGPTIYAAPQNQVAARGSDATFGVGVCGSETLVFQWYFNHQPLAGRTNDYLTITNLQYLDAGLYAVSVSNRHGLAFSVPASLTVTENPAQAFNTDQIAFVADGANRIVMIAAHGVPGHVYTLLRASSLETNAVWLPVASQPASVNSVPPGLLIFTNLNPPSPSFYRTRYP